MSDPLEQLRLTKLVRGTLHDNQGLHLTILREESPITGHHRDYMTARRVIEMEYGIWKKDVENEELVCPFVAVLIYISEHLDVPRYMMYYEPAPRLIGSADFVRIIDIEGIEILGSSEEQVFKNFLDRIAIPITRRINDE